MSRANPFGDLDDFLSDSAAKPVPAAAIDEIAQAIGFPSRKAAPSRTNETGRTPSSTRAQRRHVTGRNRQINIKATEETIERLYQVADALTLPLGAVLDQALTALMREKDIG